MELVVVPLAISLYKWGVYFSCAVFFTESDTTLVVFGRFLFNFIAGSTVCSFHFLGLVILAIVFDGKCFVAVLCFLCDLFFGGFLTLTFVLGSLGVPTFSHKFGRLGAVVASSKPFLCQVFRSSPPGASGMRKVSLSSITLRSLELPSPSSCHRRPSSQGRFAWSRQPPTRAPPAYLVCQRACWI